MPPRSRYAVDPSLSAPAQQPQSYDQSQPQYQQQPYPNQDPDRRSPLPTGPYAPSPSAPQHEQYGPHAQPHPQAPRHPSYVPPQNHIQAPPHSSGPALSGPRVRIDPSQMPNPIEAQEMDQNLWDEEDFLSCQTKGVIPLAGTDWRGVDQGGFELSQDMCSMMMSVRGFRQLSSSTSQSYSANNSDQCSTPRHDCPAIGTHRTTFCSNAV